MPWLLAYSTSEGVLRSNSACSMLMSDDLRLPRRGIEPRPSGFRDIGSTSKPSPLPIETIYVHRVVKMDCQICPCSASGPIRPESLTWTISSTTSRQIRLDVWGIDVANVQNVLNNFWKKRILFVLFNIIFSERKLLIYPVFFHKFFRS